MREDEKKAALDAAARAISRSLRDVRAKGRGSSAQLRQRIEEFRVKALDMKPKRRK